MNISIQNTFKETDITVYYCEVESLNSPFIKENKKIIKPGKSSNIEKINYNIKVGIFSSCASQNYDGTITKVGSKPNASTGIDEFIADDLVYYYIPYNTGSDTELLGATDDDVDIVVKDRKSPPL